MNIKEFIELYRQCEIEASRWSDTPVTLEYFINWLETNNTSESENNE